MPSSNQELISDYIQAYNAFDIEAMLATLSSDIQFENIENGQTTVAIQGKEEFRKLADYAASLFSSREQTITSIEWQSDSALLDIAYTATFAVDIPDGPRAGNEIHLNGHSEIYFQDGLISKIIDRS